MGARLQLLQKILTVEVPQFLHVPENYAALSPQVLGQVQALHLGEIVLNDVAERADVLPLSGNHLIHDVLHFTGEQKDTIRCKEYSKFLNLMNFDDPVTSFIKQKYQMPANSSILNKWLYFADFSSIISSYIEYFEVCHIE